MQMANAEYPVAPISQASPTNEEWQMNANDKIIYLRRTRVYEPPPANWPWPLPSYVQIWCYFALCAAIPFLGIIIALEWVNAN